MKRPWLPAELRAVRTLYPHLRTDDIARIMGRPMPSIYQKSAALGVKKSAAFMASTLSGRNVKGHAVYGVATRFKKGSVPANKGLRRPGWAPGRMGETQFRKGQFPHNHDPEFYVIGALKINSEGYIVMRTSFAQGAVGWTALHRILWEDAHGPIPRGYALVFKDREPLNVELDNLELIPRAELMRRNSVHNLPAPLKRTIQVLGQLKRRIREKQDRQFA